MNRPSFHRKSEIFYVCSHLNPTESGGCHTDTEGNGTITTDTDGCLLSLLRVYQPKSVSTSALHSWSPFFEKLSSRFTRNFTVHISHSTDRKLYMNISHFTFLKSHFILHYVHLLLHILHFTLHDW